jgi:vacuolar-type H+-ATPase subunit H
MVVFMSAEHLKYIIAAEYEANQVKLLVAEKSKESLKQAHIDGEKLVSAAVVRAKAEVEALKREADHRAMEAATELANSTANRLATMRARAEKRADIIAQRIFERIVSI